MGQYDWQSAIYYEGDISIWGILLGLAIVYYLHKRNQ